MRGVDAARIRAALDGWRGEAGRNVAEHKRVEAWRERLLARPEGALAELAAEYPPADAGHIDSLVRRALQERSSGQPPRAYRALYQALRALIEERGR